MEDFSWLKFIILTVPLIIIMWMFAPTIKWKILYSLCVPVGVYLALMGKSARKR